MSNEPHDFTREALARGIDRDEIAAALRKAGWSEGDIGNALSAFSDVPFPIPVPAPRPYAPARETFVYLLMFSALLGTAFNLGELAFDAISIFVAAETAGTFGDLAIRSRGNIAALIVFVPLFAATFAMVERTIARDPAKRRSRPRKWLTYLTLFVTGIVLCGDLIMVINAWLGGELDLVFVLKSMVIATIAGAVFGYFLLAMRRDDRHR